ncbi:MULTISPECIES: hypothetical protein [Mycobacteriaceae]|uniref:hypothetical protein n=1 Tax=Mycobacteriaceae TaxID=1762 RepID=UPI000801F869|nr:MULTISPECIES: hypothetical protein [Mycobacteriaceae]MCK0172833.1 hypothetical protein [Mycolicibacterium sp. F2034L]OBB57755.1 hypothetical protein A5757_18075 [Mycobacterium sp. 852013-51886_SCH5428379]
MADHAEALVRRATKLGFAGLGALAVAGAAVAFGSGIAGADVSDVEADPFAPFAGPVAEEGIRVADPGVVNAGPSEVRAANINAPLAPAGGESKDSIRAVPGITGGIGTYLDFGPFGGPGSPIWDW